MTATEIAALMIGAAVGGSGLVGLMFWFLRRYIDKKLTAEEVEEDSRRRNRLRCRQATDKIQHAQGRMFFWLYKAVTKPPPNGELEQAFAELQKAEDEKKALDQEILAQAQEV